MNNKPSSKIDFTIIDSLRGLASLYVCIAHCRGVLWIGGNDYIKLHPYNTWHIKDWLIMSVVPLTKLSGEAVIFFFVLSGFSIAHSLTYQPKFKPFIYKRFIRLYPPYLLGFSLALITVLILKTSPDIFFSGQYHTLLFEKIGNSLALLKPENIIRTLLYDPKLDTIITPYWSLAYEIIFYIGAIFFVRKLRSYYIISSILFITGYFIQNLFPAYLTGSVLYNFLFQYNFYFMIGMYVYHNIDRITNWKLIVNKNWWIVCLLFYFLMIGLESTIEERYNISFLFAGITCTIMIVNMLNKKIFIKPLIQIGKFSYTLYLVHFSVLILIAYCLFTFVHIPPPYLYSFFYWIPAVFICLGISYLFYLLVEKRTKKYLDTLRGKDILFKNNIHKPA
jgi:peptidoglycan/LPS O-acetylase OafA/YrhL